MEGWKSGRVEEWGCWRADFVDGADELEGGRQQAVLGKRAGMSYCSSPMSTIQEIESAVRKLPRAEIEKLSEWIQDLIEDQKKFTDEFQASIERGKRDITEGRTRLRKP
jgi:hypothetical protein